MLRFLWRASKGYRLRPWRSPYLRWRIETYWGWHAENMTARDFWRFMWQQRHDLMRFLRWVGRASGLPKDEGLHRTIRAIDSYQR
jgi:hypothetical protein